VLNVDAVLAAAAIDGDSNDDAESRRGLCSARSLPVPSQQLVRLDGTDIRPEPIKQRNLQLNKHIAEPREVVFRHCNG
jgi:hypothetical protein